MPLRLLLPLLGLLLVLLPCYGGAAGHAPTSALPPAATSALTPPPERPVPAPVAAAPGEQGAGHDATTCARGVLGGLPQGRQAADPQGSGAALLAAALLGTPVPWPGDRHAGARRGRAGGGRSVLTALCRCRI
ncbi:hypothetical protein [Streptomyces sp. NBRC 110611]|uniref:hypothetical protein n=1 Tax=Streptomyces sp. NBRC 110611 TaxID=1621259 RepID=UPI001C679357|nr:hypothetical protein [Streptomyces sp. NBRC 110611]